MNYLSVCDGIGAAHVAWKSLGWKCIGASEIERFPIEVVKHRHPEIAELGDMTRYHEWNIEAPDLVCGGTPCQSFSVAGLRKGLADPRGNLALVFLGIVDHFRPKWVVWENVPGVLSSNKGRDFGAFLGGLGQLGYGFAYRVLDAQYFGLAQRRKRVFVVGHLGSWQRAAAVLFERHSLQGNNPPSRRKGERITPAISTGATGGGGPRGDFHYDGGLVETVGAICSHGDGTDGQDAYSGRILPVQTPMLVRMREGKEGGGKGPLVSEDQSLTLATANDQILAFKGGQGERAGSLGASEYVSPTLGAADSGSNRTPTLMHGMQVRRLTPVECERLQGFPIVRQMLYIAACLDQASGSVDVALRCHRLQSGVWPVDASELMQFAATAEGHSSTPQLSQEPLALVRVLMHSGAKVQELHSAGKLIWSVKSAEGQSECRQPTQVENIAHALARHGHVVAKEIMDGKEASPQNTSGFSHRKNGEVCVTLSIAGTKASASDATNDHHGDRPQFTTSELGQVIPKEDSTLATALCSVIHAIAGSIPKQTLPANFCIAVEVGRGYTNIPWRGKPAAPDGPRYKALGNSWAVPVVGWIGQRIEMVDAITNINEVAA